MILKNLFTFAEKFFIRRNKLLFAEPALPPVGLLTTGQRVTSTTISLSQIGHFSAQNLKKTASFAKKTKKMHGLHLNAVVWDKG